MEGSSFNWVSYAGLEKGYVRQWGAFQKGREARTKGENHRVVGGELGHLEK
jgi:hypothetical protein